MRIQPLKAARFDPEEVTVIEMVGPSSWKGRTDLISVVISNNVTSIGDGAFEDWTYFNSHS